MERATLEAFRRGDPAAVRAVYERYGRLVFTIALRILNDRALAEDATQQTFVQAWQAARAYDSEREMAPWLVTIARRVAIDVMRHEAARPHSSLEDAGTAAAAWVSSSALLDRAYETWTVREAVDCLPEEERQVVRLQHLEGFTHSEIAKQLDIPLGTVKSRSNRAHRRLAGQLGYLREVAT